MQILSLDERKKRFEAWRKNAPPRITAYYLDAYYQHRDDGPILRESYAQQAFWLNSELWMSPDDLIVGAFRVREPVGFHYGCGTYVQQDVAEKYAVQEKMNAAQRADLQEKLDAVSARAYQYYAPIFTDEEVASIQAHAATTTWFGGHMVLDYETILQCGLPGYRAKIQQAKSAHGEDKRDFFEAMTVTLDSIVAVLQRFADAAQNHGQSMKEVADVLRHIAAAPPVTFHQALQLVWMLHMLDNSDSFGRFDEYLLPFFKHDLETGFLTKERAKALLTDFWLKIELVEQIQNMTIGGIDQTGKPQYSELTALCMDITRELAYKGPNLCLRITADMPEEYWSRAIACIGTGIGQPALYNDGLFTASLIGAGIPNEAARGYCLAGCSQVMIPGQSNFVNDIGLLNVGKIAEVTLFGGIDPQTGVRIGPDTGENFSSFDKLYAAFEEQLRHFCRLEVSIHNKEIPYRASREGYALRTLFIQDCLEKGKGVFEGGARYNNTELELIGITNAADSLYAVKRAVFDEKRISLSCLRDVLRRDWANEEELHRYFVSLPKFGNGFDGVDELRVRITDWLYAWFNAQPAPLGGIYVPGEVIFTSHEGCGSVTGATPDGRRAGQVMADSAGAEGGCDKEGPTALMNSVLRLPYRDYLLTSIAVNMRFLPDTFNAARSRKGITALLKGYFAQGGMQLQINVCSSDELRCAQADPDSYPGLIVRVGGYSDYFVRLSHALQDEIIKRTAHDEGKTG